MKTADMKTIWDRIHVWLAANAPVVLESLRPGATDEAIRAAEEAMGVTLPDDVRACYRIHDGQQPVLVNVTYWPGLRAVPTFLYADPWLGLKEMVECWEVLHSLLGEFSEVSSSPRGPIRSDWWHPKWLPVTKYGGGGDYHCLDLAPKSRGKVGQVIFWLHDDAARGVLAKSFTEWLAAFASDLERGQYTTAPDRTTGLIHVRDL
jgi:cell wall assembly regulator SMI1